MSLFSIKKPKQKQEPQKDTYYIEPAKEDDPETHENWEEQQWDKSW